MPDFLSERNLYPETSRLKKGWGLFLMAIFGLFIILFLDYLFFPTLIDLLEFATGRFASLEVAIRAHLLIVCSQLLLFLIYLLHINPTREPRKRILLYFLAVEILIVCSVWIFDPPYHRFRSEDSALTFFSAFLLLVCSLAAFLNLITLNFIHKTNRLAKTFWILITFAFLCAGLDEYFTLHEMASKFSKSELSNDIITFTYAIGAAIFVFYFYKALKDDLPRSGVFFRVIISAITIFSISVFFDTFDYLFEPLDKYFSTYELLNSLEELLEFTAAMLFLYAFVLNLLEANNAHILTILRTRIKAYRPHPVLKKSFWGFLVLAFTVSLGAKMAFRVGKEPIIFEKGHKVSLFADISDGLSRPDGLRYSRNLGLVLANEENASTVLIFDRKGQSRVFADAETGIASPEGLAVQGKSLFVADDVQRVVMKYSRPGTPPTVVVDGGFKSPDGLAVDAQGNLYIADEKLSMVVKVSGNAHHVLASSLDGLESPEAMVFDDQENLYVTDETARAVFKISPTGKATKWIDETRGMVNPEGIAFHGGQIYVTDGKAGIIYRYNLDGSGGKFISFSKKFRGLSGIAFDELGALYVVSTAPFSARGYIFRIELGQ